MAKAHIFISYAHEDKEWVLEGPGNIHLIPRIRRHTSPDAEIWFDEGLVIGEKWDYLWRTEEDYLEWSEKWIAEAARVLRMGGSFYLFGYFRMLSRLLPILEKYGFELRQQIILNKGMQAVSGRATKNYRMFPNVTESILFLCKDPKPFAKSSIPVLSVTLKSAFFISSSYCKAFLKPAFFASSSETNHISPFPSSIFVLL